MKKRVLVIAALVSGALAVSGCTTNPYTGEREAGKSGIGAGIGSWWALALAYSPPPRKIAAKVR